MELLKKIFKQASPFEMKIEDTLVSFWQWWIRKKYSKNRFVDIVAVGLAEDNTLYAKGFCPVTIGPHVKRPSVVLRSMVQSKLLLDRGPMPEEKTHLLVLLTLPSFLVRGSLKNIKQFVKDWNGKTEAFGLPYCFYTTMR